MKTVGLFIMGCGITLFYFVFFKLAPYVGSLIPSTDWTPILKIVIYILMGWLGGIAIPLIIVIFGFGLFLQGL